MQLRLNTTATNGGDDGDVELRLLRLWQRSIEDHRNMQLAARTRNKTANGNGAEHGAGKAELSDAELHRATRQAVAAADGAVFVDLAGLINQVIERELWKRYGFRDFAAYALSAGSGLGIATDRHLFLLRCIMDVHGKHLKEWAGVLAQVDASVRVAARKQGKTINSLRANSHSLRTLARDRAAAGVTYLPSYQRGPGALDGALVRLHRNKPDVFQKVIAGEVTLAEASRQRKPGDVEPSSFDRLRRQIERHVNFLTAQEKAKLRELLA